MYNLKSARIPCNFNTWDTIMSNDDDPISGNTDWSRAQLGWGQFNHFQGEYTSSHSSHQHSSHASHAGTPSSGTGNSASAAEWYDQGYDYSQHAQLNYHRSVGGIF